MIKQDTTMLCDGCGKDITELSIKLFVRDVAYKGMKDACSGDCAKIIADALLTPPPSDE